MTENFDNGENSKAKNLFDKVKEVVQWDLGSLCHTTEECDMVDQAKKAMKELGAMLSTSTSFSSDDTQKNRTNLSSINEVLSWDLNPADELEIDLIREARKSLKALQELF